MFKHAFHGGPAVEIFSVSGKNPLEKWKTTGSIPKTFDSNMKSFIFTVEGQSKIQLPKDEKELLGLIQPFLVLQIFIPLGKNIHIEVGITDSTKTRRRLIFHSGAKEIAANPLHARIPITNFRRNQWTNLAIDVHTFTHHCFKGVNFRSIDLLIITASCKLRRIFTMKNPLYDDQQEDDIELNQLVNLMMAEELRENMPFEYVPSNLGFPQTFVHFNQLIFPHRLRQKPQGHDENVNIGNNVTDPKKEPKVQLAFGQRMLKKQDQPPSAQLNMKPKLPTTANTNQRNMQQQSVNTGTKQVKNKDLQQVQNDQNDEYADQRTNQQSNRNASHRKQSQEEYQEDLQQEEIQHDVEEDEDFYDYQEGQDTKYDHKGSKQYVTKEELKEGEHFLYLQNQSDEEKNDDSETKRGKSVRDANPWDKMGRVNHDNTIKKPALIKDSSSKNNLKQHSMIKETSSLKKKVSYQLEDKNDEDFYSPLQSERDKKQIDIRVQQDINEYQLRQQEQKVLEMKKQVQHIESKYNKQELYGDKNAFEEIKSPEMNKNRQKSKITSKVNTNNHRVKLKQDKNPEYDEDDVDQDGFKRFTNNKMNNNFNLESWGNMQKDEDDMIEEAFDMMNNNLINFDDKPLESIGNSSKSRKSKEYKENPMYIEFELNNDEEDEIQDQVNGIADKDDTQKLNNIDKEVTQSYIRLESSRKEERRPFSPPFKLQQDLNLQKEATEIHTAIENQDEDDDILLEQQQEEAEDEIVQTTDFKRKLDFLKVQRADILRDSLDNTVPRSNTKQRDLPNQATVENEDGDLLEVIFDPILQCYYDPKSNSYYELKDQN